jgi:hypothetical protein
MSEPTDTRIAIAARFPQAGGPSETELAMRQRRTGNIDISVEETDALFNWLQKNGLSHYSMAQGLREFLANRAIAAGVQPRILKDGELLPIDSKGTDR